MYGPQGEINHRQSSQETFVKYLFNTDKTLIPLAIELKVDKSQNLDQDYNHKGIISNRHPEGLRLHTPTYRIPGIGVYNYDS